MFDTFKTSKKALKKLRLTLGISTIIFFVLLFNIDKSVGFTLLNGISLIIVIILIIVVSITSPLTTNDKVIEELKKIKKRIELENPNSRFNITIAEGTRTSYYVVATKTESLTVALIYDKTMMFVIPITDYIVKEPILLKHADFDPKKLNLNNNKISFQFPGSKIIMETPDLKTEIFRNEFENNNDAYLKLRDFFNIEN